MHVCMRVCVYACMHIYMCTYLCMHVCVNAYRHAYTYMCYSHRRRIRTTNLPPQPPLLTRLRRLPLPWKGARVLPEQSDAVGGDELALGVEEDEG